MGCMKCCCIIVLIIALIVAASMGLLTALFPYPSHASCRAVWTFGEDCSAVQNTLVDKMKEWSATDCPSEDLCGYEYLGYDGNEIKATHTTPVTKYVDSLHFSFQNTIFGCEVLGFSRSDVWYAVLDFGVNYCNLKDLIVGSGLNRGDVYYTEDSSDANCTMYSVAHCRVSS